MQIQAQQGSWLHKGGEADRRCSGPSNSAAMQARVLLYYFAMGSHATAATWLLLAIHGHLRPNCFLAAAHGSLPAHAHGSRE